MINLEMHIKDLLSAESAKDSEFASGYRAALEEIRAQLHYVRVQAEVRREMSAPHATKRLSPGARSPETPCDETGFYHSGVLAGIDYVMFFLGKPEEA